jgi:hypothetical protein
MSIDEINSLIDNTIYLRGNEWHIDTLISYLEMLRLNYIKQELIQVTKLDKKSLQVIRISDILDFSI